MARYTGPERRIWRRLGPESAPPWVRLGREENPPGQHGGAKARGGKQSEHARQLIEKQKLRYYYGVLEKQFRRYVARSQKLTGVAGHNLIRLLETRLDAVVYRLGFATSMRAARQLVNHGHIEINGRKCDICSAQVQVGDHVGVREKSRSLRVILDAMEMRGNVLPPYLALSPAQREGELITEPLREDIPINVNERLVIEYYSRRNVRV
ncbi:MAG: 30S ribosomal protein S4 [Armatimonadetes bacterium]|nr:30S ribosomal protein S4 [Armatimonadota bacterium]